MTYETYLKEIDAIKIEGYVELHVHSDGSHRDATSRISEIFDATANLGRHAVAVTDHGMMARLFDCFKERTKYEKKILEKILFANNVPENDIKAIMKAIGSIDSIRKPSQKLIPFIEKYGEMFVEAVKNSIKFVPGIEEYTCPDAEYKGYFHMEFFAKDEIGLKELFKLANLAELNQYKGRGRATHAILERLFAEGSVGHGHVIATSSCMQGPLSVTLLKPQNIDKEIRKQQTKLSALPEVDMDAIESFEAKIAERTQQLKDARIAKNAAASAVKKNFDLKISRAEKKISTLEATIASLTGKDDATSLRKLATAQTSLAEAKDALATVYAEKEANDALAKTLDARIAEIDELTVAIKQAKDSLTAIKKQAEPHERIRARIAELENEKARLGDVYAEAKDLAIMFNNIFGEGNFFIELQNHGIPQELYILPYLKKISAETGIPMTVANDVHYIAPKDSRKRSAVVAIRRGKMISDIEAEVGNDQLYFKTNEQMQKLFADVPEALLGPAKIANACNVVITHDEWHLPKYDTGSSETAKEYLTRVAKENISAKFPNFDTQSDDWKKMFDERLNYELDVIENMGFSNYIAIVHDYVRQGRKIGGRAAVGPGRGSAAGSLVCYLVDITDVDPLRYSLLFERFLNPARVSMPDIDVDFAAFIREEVISYVTELYSYKEEYPVPEISHTVCNIMTEGVFAARSAIRNVGRVTGVPLDFCDKIAKMIPNKPKMTIVKAFDENPDFKNAYDTDADAKQLIDDAMLIEGLPSHTGVHAAGVIIADKPITEYAPMLWNDKKGVWVIQYDMVSCEKDLKLLKMDFLGLTNLDIITDAIKFIKENHDVEVNLDIVNRADDPAVLSSIYSKGLTNGVFQFESSGMRDTLIGFAPRTIDDVALLNAAYRPGPMQYIKSVTDVKFGREKKQYIVPQMAEILDETYGKPIYQEQIQKIFANIAGFDLGTADIIRRAMAKKHLDELVEHKDKFFNGLLDKGAKQSDVDTFWEELLDFANYAFNKSHAVAYSLVSYQTAWLKHYYPTEYMAALLKYTPIAKIPFYIKEANAFNIRVLSPNINKSNRDFEPTTDGNIQFGLRNIKGVSNNSDSYITERNARGEFKSFNDMIIRMTIAGVNIRPLKFLILSGAMDSIIPNKNRKVYSEFAQECLDSCRACYKKVSDKPEIDPYAYIRSNWIAPVVEQGPNFDKLTVLKYEKELIGFYVSGHPLDDYKGILANNASTEIAEIDETTVASRNNVISIAGQIHDFMLLRRKSDGKAMCKFTFMDLTGEMECICFTKTFETYSALIADNAIVKLIGYPEIETEETDDGVNVISKQFVVTEVRTLSQPKALYCFINTMMDYVDTLQPAINKLAIGNDKVNIIVKSTNQYFETDYLVSATSEFLADMKKKGIVCHFERKD